MMTVLNTRWVSILVAGLLMLHTSFASATLIYDLKFSDVDTVEVGESFDVEVSLDDPLFTDLFAFGFDLVSPLNTVTFDGFTVATDNGIEPILLDEYDVGGFVIGFPFDNVLATLHFTAVSAGLETLSFFSVLNTFDGTGGAHFYDNLNDGNIEGSFDVNVVEAQVPEPSSMAIMLLGVLGIVRMRSTQKNNVTFI